MKFEYNPLLNKKLQKTVNSVTDLIDHTKPIHDVLGIDYNSLSNKPTLSVNIKQTEIDFGVIPVESASFVIADADVLVNSQLIGNVAYEAPTGKDLDELEMDSLDLKFAPGVGQFTLYAKGLEGYIADKFKINYLIG